ncbi:MAG: hypothetical protein KAF24_02460, partial [Nitrosopumilaceae archaeon]|nr:hypothetical protein [Nitrosopumilaceae archaeon]
RLFPRRPGHDVSKINNSLAPWILILKEYLYKHEYIIKMFYTPNNLNKIHIKIIDIHENKK